MPTTSSKLAGTIPDTSSIIHVHFKSIRPVRANGWSKLELLFPWNGRQNVPVYLLLFCKVLPIDRALAVRFRDTVTRRLELCAPVLGNLERVVGPIEYQNLRPEREREPFKVRNADSPLRYRLRTRDNVSKESLYV